MEQASAVDELHEVVARLIKENPAAELGPEKTWGELLFGGRMDLQPCGVCYLHVGRDDGKLMEVRRLPAHEPLPEEIR